MGWFANRFDKWAERKQREELTAFVENLRASDSGELSAIVAMATHVRHGLEAEGHLVTDPIIYCSTNLYFPFLLSRTIGQLQKESKLQVAVGFMVWLHTARAGVRLELRQLGRDMWRELARGFGNVEETAADLSMLTGQHLNVEGATEFPKGFTPDPL